MFLRYSEILVKKLLLLTYHIFVCPSCWGDSVVILLRPLAPENYSPWAIAWHYLRDPTFSHFGTTLECDRRTGRYTWQYAL